MATVPHLVARIALSDQVSVPIAEARFDLLEDRLARFAVDRTRYTGTAGELLLQRMPPEPRAQQVDERIARLRERSTETRLDLLRRVMALPAVKR